MVLVILLLKMMGKGLEILMRLKSMFRKSESGLRLGSRLLELKVL